ncbi:hemerythrin domain-containing protein [Clostridium chrysemydis]|uniref:hemerythrin domain-containing protein n=1 Tax=Clostridium chrysemydis TaxID=2665504 RepID=UPI00188360A3|nr:hemerythrin domain-containing protein [Clostridium chrysemydis]
MINSNLIRQHKDFYELLNKMKGLLKNTSENSKELALNINLLAGKLNIHLQSEDKFLYPTLINSQDIKLKNIAKDFINEMGHIANTYSDFKVKYNTQKKILDNLNDFNKDCTLIINTIENRLMKEDTKLYVLL